MSGDVPGPAPRVGTRLDSKALLALAAGGLALAIVIGVVLVTAKSPDAPGLGCVGRRCPTTRSAPALVSLHHWRSPATGFEVAWWPQLWDVTRRTASGVTLSAKELDIVVTLDGARGPGNTPAALLRGRLDDLRERAFSLELDRHTYDRILGPHLGFVDGIGRTYVGAVEDPQGTGANRYVYLLAAGDGTVSVVLTAITGEQDYYERAATLEAADLLIDTVKFPSEQAS